MQMDVLNRETVHAYRNRHMAYRSEHVWEQLKDEEYLERIGAAKVLSTDGKLHPTAAGLLMFGDEYKILYEYPEYFLDFRELLDPSIRWTDRLPVWQCKGSLENLEGTRIASHYALYPVPAAVLAAQPDFKQNPGY